MGKISFFFRRFFLFVIRLFFLHLENGETCVICGNKTFYYPVCDGCRKRFFSMENVISVKRCVYCGKELFSEEECCLQCRTNRVLLHTDLVMPLFSYRLWNKQLMFLWKKRDVRSLSYFFCKMINFVLEMKGIKVIVPVPPRPGKIQENGWDQIDEVCSYLKFYFGFKVFDVLERKSVHEQKKLDRRERLQTIGQSYERVNDLKLGKILKRFSNIVPREVCIIDDVLTTGATIESCAGILKNLGVEKVNAITLFIVD